MAYRLETFAGHGGVGDLRLSSGRIPVDKIDDPDYAVTL